MPIQVVKIKSLSPTGHGVAENGWYILGVFPGDIVHAQEYKIVSGTSYAEIIKIIKPSIHRMHWPKEKPFFDPNAPWQYLSIEQENIEKLKIIKNIFNTDNVAISDTEKWLEANQEEEEEEERSAETKPSKNNKLSTSQYRNKASYAFMKNNQGQLSFALFTRGTKNNQKIVQQGNPLVHPVIDILGKKFLHFFNQKKVPLETLKYLTLRYSYHTNTAVAQILVTETNRKKIPWKKLELVSFINQHKSLQGIIVSYSEPNIRSALTDKDFYSLGDINICEKVLDKKYHYHPSLFFQIYPKAFEEILLDIRKSTQDIDNHSEYEFLDLFSGVGIIGLEIAELVKKVHGVELSSLSKKYAEQNALTNNIKNFTFSESSVDDILTFIKPEQIVMVDPTRSGLNQKTIDVITKIKPKYLFYLSCNPETQHRDFEKIKEYYKIKFLKAYNIFPKTQHIESLLILYRK